MSFSLLTFPSTIPLLVGKIRPAFTAFLSRSTPATKPCNGSDLADPHVLKPGVKLFSGARAKHLCKLLNQLICLVHFRMQRSKQCKGFLIFVLQFFRSTK